MDVVKSDSRRLADRRWNFSSLFLQQLIYTFEAFLDVGNALAQRSR
jgi:hypothetical protein